MDPYIVIHWNGAKYRTTVKKNAGCFPSWRFDDQKFEIKLKTQFDLIMFSGHDEGVLVDKFLGRSQEFTASQLEEMTKSPAWVDLYINGTRAGAVKLQTKMSI